MVEPTRPSSGWSTPRSPFPRTSSGSPRSGPHPSQPAFLPSETDWLERRLGRDRMRWTYAFASLAAAGVPLAGGSDSPVEAPEPLRGMAAARHRSGIVPVESLGAELPWRCSQTAQPGPAGCRPRCNREAQPTWSCWRPIRWRRSRSWWSSSVLATYVDGDEVWRHPDHSVTGRSGPPSPRQ